MPPITQSFGTESIGYDNLFAGGAHPITNGATLLTGTGIVARGTVLGKITASGKLKPYLAASSDGSQIPYAINGNTIDTTTGDQLTMVYLYGQFNKNALIGWDANAQDLLRDVGIFVQINPTAAGVN